MDNLVRVDKPIMAQSELNQLTGNNGPSESGLEETSSPLGSPDYFPFMELPREIRGMIYQHIPQAQIGNLTLVCQQFRAEIDELYTFAGIINEDKAGRERMFGLRLSSCLIEPFVTDQPELVFKYPRLLKNVIVYGKNNSRSIESVVNVYRLLMQCAQNLERLKLHYFYTFRDAIPYSLTVANFSSLKTLHIEVEHSRDELEQLEPINQLFCNCTLNSLRALWMFVCIFSDDSALSKYTCPTLALVAQNWKTIESVWFHAFSDAYDEDELLKEDLQLVDFKSLAKLTQLKRFGCWVETTFMPSDSKVIPLWSGLLQQQSELVICAIDFPLPWTMLNTIISKNFLSLNVLSLGCLLAEDNDRVNIIGDEEFVPFDMTFFQHCAELTSLDLTLKDCLSKIQVSNLSNLPTSLLKLRLENFRVLPDNFYEYCSSPSFNSNFSSVSIVTPFDKYDELIEKCKSEKPGFKWMTLAERVLIGNPNGFYGERIQE